jgi:hypothetical protein
MNGPRQQNTLSRPAGIVVFAMRYFSVVVALAFEIVLQVFG